MLSLKPQGGLERGHRLPDLAADTSLAVGGGGSGGGGGGGGGGGRVGRAGGGARGETSIATAPKRHEETFWQFMGVAWNKRDKRWQAYCKGKYLGQHATVEAAAQAYNIEAERLGVPLNVIPPAVDTDDGNNIAAAAPAPTPAPAAAAAAASPAPAAPAAPTALALPPYPAAPARAHAGAGSKRTAPTTPAPPPTKSMRPVISAGAAASAAAVAAQRATPQAHIKVGGGAG